MFENKKVLILGMARSGYEAAKVLLKKGCEVILNDNKSEDSHDIDKVNELSKLGCKLVFGGHPDDLLDKTFDYVIKNPGITPKHKYVTVANELGIPVINEVEMAYLLLPKNVTLIAITGTNGKTTTTTLIYEIIKNAKRRVHLTGNIGYPLCSFLDKIHEGDIIVMETSCQQLVNLDKYHPNICVMTNLSEAHTDFLDSYDNYKRVKAKIYKEMTLNDLLVLNRENEDLFEMTKNVSNTNKVYFSINNDALCYYRDGAIYYDNQEVIKVDDIVLKGEHNYENIMASIIVACRLGISFDEINEVLRTFQGVAHRLEYLGEISKRKFYNDSKATNIKSTQIALSSFNRPTILLLGGLERHQDFHELDKFMTHVKLIVCYGENKERIVEFGNDLGIKTIKCEVLKDAFDEAYHNSQENDIILLSPASASWDQYKCFEDRGDEYRKCYFNLLEKEKENEN